MKNKHSLVVSISNKSDLDKITKDTKYINIDISNVTHEVITYFIEHGDNYLYSEMVNGVKGYIYVSHSEFFKAENLIEMIYVNMPNNLTKLEIAKYLYISIAKIVSFDINVDTSKNELCNLSLMNSVNNLWGSLSLGRVSDISAAKIYYYLCKRLDIDITLVVNDETKEALNKLEINNQVLIVDLFNDIPYIQVNMQTRHFATYNDDIDLDKKIKYIKTKYNDYYIDKALKNIDYTKEDCVQCILHKTEKLIDISNIKPVELSIIYEYIFNTYCPNYNIKINNLFLNNESKKHFIMISYNDNHYSYNYKKKSFVKVNDNDILDNLNIGKIGIYQNEYIPNIN